MDNCEVQEYQPLLLSDNTEVKVPFTSSEGANCTPEGETDERYLNEYYRLVEHYRNFPTDIFIAQLLKDYASNETDLESTRLLFFEALKEYNDFPYSLQAELKRRVFTRKGEPVVVKLATDIHSLLGVMEGEEYSSMKEMLSSSKGRTNSTTHSVSDNRNMNNCQCSAETALLKDAVSSLQADVLLLKQTLHASEKLHIEQMKTVSLTLNGIKTDIMECGKCMIGCTSEARSKIDDVRECMNPMLQRISSVENRMTSLDTLLDSANCVSITKYNMFDESESDYNRMRVIKHPSEINSDFVDQSENCDNVSHGHAIQNVEVAVHSGSMGAQPENVIFPLPHNVPESNCAPLVDLVDQTEYCDNVDRGHADQNVEHTIYSGSMSAQPENVTLAPPTNVTVANCAPLAAERTAFSRGHSSAISTVVRPRDSGMSTGTSRLRNVRQRSSTGIINPIPVRMVPRKNKQTDNNYDGFENFVRRKSKRFYVGGFKNTITVEKLSTFVNNRGPQVTMIRIFPMRKSNDKVVIRLNVAGNVDASLVLEDGFWPRGITCHPWMSRGGALLRRRQCRRQPHGRDGESWEDEHRDVNDDVDDNYVHENRFEALSKPEILTNG